MLTKPRPRSKEMKARLVNILFSVLVSLVHLPAIAAAPHSIAWLGSYFPDRVLDDFSKASNREELASGLSFLVATEPRLSLDERILALSLMIDIYHSLPPGKDPAGYNTDEISGKGNVYREIEWSEYRNRRKYYRENWNEFKADEKWEFVRQTAYLFEYLHIKEIELDPFLSEAQFEPSVIDFLQPNHYIEMRQWMSAQATASSRQVPPWEAEDWTLAHCSEWGGCDGLEFEPEETDEAPEAGDTIAFDDTTEAVGHIGDVVKSREPEPSSPEQDEKTVNPLRVWGALGAVVLFGLSIGLFAIFRGRRKPD